MDWLYGRNVVRLVAQGTGRRRPHRLAATPAGLKALGDVPRGLPADMVSGSELDELCGSHEHQGVAVQVDSFAYASADDVLRSDMVVVLDEVSDPHNLGAVARSALAAGAGGLVVPRHRSAAVTPAAVKASAGVIELLPVAQVTNTVAFLKQAKHDGFWVYGAAGEAKTSYLRLDLSGRVVLVFGAEGHGLRPLVAHTCDVLAKVPISPQVESLNVSVAAALFLFEARRQAAAYAQTSASPDTVRAAEEMSRQSPAKADKPRHPGSSRPRSGGPGGKHAGRRPRPGPKRGTAEGKASP